MSDDGVRAIDSGLLPAFDRFFVGSLINNKKVGPREALVADAALQMLQYLPTGALKSYTSLASLQADKAPELGTIAYVVGGADEGVYRKSAAANSTGWTQILDYIPGSQIVVALDNGSGSANAIKADTNVRVSSLGTQIVIVNSVVRTNTGAATISFNNGAALPIVDIGDVAMSAGGIAPGMTLVGRVQSGEFRLLFAHRGWSPLIRIVPDGLRRVMEVYGYTGGLGAKPTAVGYVTAVGAYSPNIAVGADIRGLAGPSGPGTGDMLSTVYDPQGIEEDLFDSLTRSALVARSGIGFRPGRIYRAEGMSYIGSPGATAIPDMPGMLPFGDIFVQHFGVRADLTYVEEEQIYDNAGVGQYGFRRTGGSDQREKVVAADAYCYSIGKRLWFADGAYYISGEVEIRSRWLAESDFKVILWLEYYKTALLTPSQSGLWIKTSGAGLGVPGNHGFKLVGQFNTSIQKEGGNGQRGSIIKANEYWTAYAQPIIYDICVRAKVTRALLQYNSVNAIVQRSIPSPLTTFMAGIERAHYELSLWGRTNVRCDGIGGTHWGCRYDPSSIKVCGATLTNGGSGYVTAPTVTVTGGGPGVTATAVATATINVSGQVTAVTFSDWGAGYTERPVLSFSGGGGTGAEATCSFGDAETLDKNLGSIIESYHSVDYDFYLLEPVDNNDGFRLANIWDAASCGYARIHNLRSRNVAGSTIYGGALGSISAGDNADVYTVASQKGKIGRGIKWINCEAVGVNGLIGSDQLFIKGAGETKVNADREPETRVLRQYQLEDMEIELVNCRIVFAPDAIPGNQRGLYAARVHGSIKGDFESWGAHKAVELEWCNGVFDLELRGDGAFVNNWASGVKLRDNRSDRKAIPNSGDASGYAYGYDSATSRAVEVLGSVTAIGNLAVAVAVGDTSLKLAAPLPLTLIKGDRISYNGGGFTISRIVSAGALYLPIELAHTALGLGAALSARQRAQQSGKTSTNSSSYGVRVINGEVRDLDISDMRMFGRSAVYASGDSLIDIAPGRLPMGGAGGASSTERRTLRIADQTRLTARNVSLRKNTRVSAHLLMEGASTATFTGCSFEDVSTAIAFSGMPTAAEKAKRLRLIDCTDFNGAPVVSPARSATFVPTITIGGVNTGITYGARSGSWSVTDEDRCHVEFDVALTSKGGLAGAVEIAWDAAIPIPAMSSVGTIELVSGMSGLSGAYFLKADASARLVVYVQGASGRTSFQAANMTDTARLTGSVSFKI